MSEPGTMIPMKRFDGEWWVSKDRHLKEVQENIALRAVLQEIMRLYAGPQDSYNALHEIGKVARDALAKGHGEKPTGIGRGCMVECLGCGQVIPLNQVHFCPRTKVARDEMRKKQDEKPSGVVCVRCGKFSTGLYTMVDGLWYCQPCYKSGEKP